MWKWFKDNLTLIVGAEAFVTKLILLYRLKDVYIVVIDLDEIKSTVPIDRGNMEIWRHDRASKTLQEYASENDELGMESTHEQMTKQKTGLQQEDNVNGWYRMLFEETDCSNSCAGTSTMK